MKKIILWLFIFCFFSQAFAIDKVVVLPGGNWSTFSTPKILSSLTFDSASSTLLSNSWAGLFFYTLSWGTWQSVKADINTIKPLEWYMIYNSNLSDVNLNLTYKPWATPTERLFSKNLNAWWNLVWITSLLNPLSSIWQNATMAVDFTKTWTANWQNLVIAQNSIYNWNSSLSGLTPDFWESYAVFMSAAWIYGGTQSPVLDYSINYTATWQTSVNVTPWATWVKLLEFNMDSGANWGAQVKKLIFRAVTSNWIDLNGILIWTSLKITNVKTGDIVHQWWFGAAQDSTLNFDILNAEILPDEVIIPLWWSWLTVEVFADFKNNVPVNTSFSIWLKSADAIVNNADKDMLLTDSDWVSNITWPMITFQEAVWDLDVVRNDGLSDSSILPGTKWKLVYGANFTTTQSKPYSLSYMTVNTTGTAVSYTGGNTFLTLYVNGVATSTKSLTSNSVIFDGFTANVSKTAPLNIQIKADFSDVTNSGTFQIPYIIYNAVNTLTSTAQVCPQIPGAIFTIRSADAQFGVSDLNPLANVFLAGSTNNRLFSFKVTAQNDNVNLKNITLTGSSLGAFSNFKLYDSAGVLVANSSSEGGTGVIFNNIDAVKSLVEMDKSVKFSVHADADANTDATWIQLSLTSATIRWTNGTEVTPSSIPQLVSNAHAVAQNTAVIAKASNPSKNLATSALRFTVSASGQNMVTLTSIDLTSLLAWYTGSIAVNVYKDAISIANLAGTGAIWSNQTIAIWNGKNTVDIGSTSTYIIVADGAVIDAWSPSSDWSILLKNVTFDWLSAKDYSNIGQFPISEVK